MLPRGPNALAERAEDGGAPHSTPPAPRVQGPEGSGFSAFRRRLGLYVHVPFCSIKCYYCDFTAFSGQWRQKTGYVEAVAREAGLYQAAEPVETLYIGGGTPTDLSAEDLESLLEGLGSRYGDIGGLSEATIEASPESTDAAKLDVLRRLGIGRVSFGLQTAQDRNLKAIGRRHTFDDFKRVYDEARRRGLSVSVDLMLGLPGQTMGDVAGSLERTLELEPDHFSVYGLQVEDRTLFAKRAVRADEDFGREALELTIERLDRAGYRHYEISNFARPGRQSLHNVNYWLDGRYIGLGCGASGHLNGVRWQNEDRLQPYLERIERGERPVAHSEHLTGKEKLGETLMLGLRLLGGVPLSAEAETAFGPGLERLRERGLVELESGPEGRCARLSARGVFLGNEVFRELVPPYDEDSL